MMITWSETFYTPLLLNICMLITFVVGLRHKSKEKMSVHFLVYISSAMLLFLGTDLTICILNLDIKDSIFLETLFNTLFAMAETYIFYTFFSYVITSKKFKIIFTLFVVLLFVLLTLLVIKIMSFKSSISTINSVLDKVLTLELSLLAVCCLYYFYELLSQKTDKNLMQSPSFWIVTGLFFYCLAIIPFFLIATEIRVNRPDIYLLLFSIHFLFMSILFLCITKAFLCKKPLTT